MFFSAFSISALTKLTACFSTSSAILWLYLASRMYKLTIVYLTWFRPSLGYISRYRQLFDFGIITAVQHFAGEEEDTRPCCLLQDIAIERYNCARSVKRPAVVDVGQAQRPSRRATKDCPIKIVYPVPLPSRYRYYLAIQSAVVFPCCLHGVPVQPKSSNVFGYLKSRVILRIIAHPLITDRHK